MAAAAPAPAVLVYNLRNPLLNPIDTTNSAQIKATTAAEQVGQREKYLSNNPLDQNILQIFDEEINDTIHRLKMRLGNPIAGANPNYEDTNEIVNQNVKKIIDHLQGLSDAINANQIYNINNPTVIVDRDINSNIMNIGSAPDTNPTDPPGLGSRSYLEWDVANNKYIKKYEKHRDTIGNQIDLTNVAISQQNFNQLKQNRLTNYNNNNPGVEFNTLDSGVVVAPIDANYTIPNHTTGINEAEATPEQIQQRLNNCANLEYLYLAKHDELMTTFTFTLNLFDKYKYAIKVMLFLLKNLVYKDSKKIKLPKPLITNIQKLLKDQATVQGVITNMEETLENNDIKQRTSALSATDDPFNPEDPAMDTKIADDAQPANYVAPPPPPAVP